MRFKQVDVFGTDSLDGNPVAVVSAADSLSTEAMQRFARWTNLSETTFLVESTDPKADYRVRIFTPATELPFAGHPTLGTAHAWIEFGGRPKTSGRVIQECGVGLVDLKVGSSGELSFAAPPLLRSGEPDTQTIDFICSVINVDRDEIVSAQWVDNGPGWVAVELADAAAVLAVKPNLNAAPQFDIGVVGFYPEGTSAVGAAYEVRAFFAEDGVALEDPVTGSLNASLAQWLVGEGKVQTPYLATQGSSVGANGTVRIDQSADKIWVGGRTVTYIDGSVEI